MKPVNLCVDLCVLIRRLWEGWSATVHHPSLCGIFKFLRMICDFFFVLFPKKKRTLALHLLYFLNRVFGFFLICENIRGR